jgi:hypothetical protein
MITGNKMSRLLKQIKLVGIFICTTIFTVGCEKQNVLPVSSNNTITAASVSYLTNATIGAFSAATAATINGNDIIFNYTGAAATAVDVTKMRIYVTLPNNAKLTQPLDGLKDLTNPLPISVMAGNGSIRNYNIKVVKIP